MGPEKWTANFVAPINFSILILTCPDVSPKGRSHMIELMDLKLNWNPKWNWIELDLKLKWIELKFIDLTRGCLKSCINFQQKAMFSLFPGLKHVEIDRWRLRKRFPPI